MKKYNVGILGATGAVGQRYISLLQDHPWFKITRLMASHRSRGKQYKDAVSWRLPHQISDELADLSVSACEPEHTLDFVFSGLPASEADTVEPLFARSGIPVVSNTRSFRMDPLVPLIVPEINLEHLHLIRKQQEKFNSSGFIVTNPNCSTIVLTLALAPLHRLFGINKIQVATAQAVSGAGYPGISVMSILDNVLPYIDGEEPKMESEPLKIFGTYTDEKIIPAEMMISASCNRVSVSDGHLMNVAVTLEKEVQKSEIIKCWNEYSPDTLGMNLPSLPVLSVEYLDYPDRPQPLLDRDRGNGMTVCTGRLRPCPVMGWKFTALGHNTIRGAAGGAILVAECLAEKGYFRKN